MKIIDLATDLIRLIPNVLQTGEPAEIILFDNKVRLVLSRVEENENV